MRFRVIERWFFQGRERAQDHGPPARSTAEGRRPGAHQRDVLTNDPNVRRHGLQGHGRLPALEDQVMLEDGCAEGIWMEALEKTAVPAPGAGR